MIQSLNDGSGGFIYDVGVSVGAGGYNYQEDTMLVQYFMRWIATMRAIKGDPNYDGAMVVAVDGIVGPKTLTAIYVYQQRTPGLDVDLRVDPTQATIMMLNFDFRAAWPYLDPAMPQAWPAPPPLLAGALARVASQFSAATT